LGRKNVPAPSSTVGSVSATPALANASDILGTKEDVDAYLAKLRSAREAAIEAGERVEIR